MMDILGWTLLAAPLAMWGAAIALGIYIAYRSLRGPGSADSDTVG